MPTPDYGDFDPDLPMDWEVWYCEDEGYALVPSNNAQAKLACQVKTLLGVFHGAYNEAKGRMTDLCSAHNASLSPAFPPPDTGHPAWVQCDNCDDYRCEIHNMHAHDCACPAVEDWPPGLDPYLTGGPSTDSTPTT